MPAESQTRATPSSAHTGDLSVGKSDRWSPYLELVSYAEYVANASGKSNGAEDDGGRVGFGGHLLSRGGVPPLRQSG
jgi:hypothetical protein